MRGSRMRLWTAAGVLASALALGPFALGANPAADNDFAPIMGELRSDVAYAADLRTQARSAGDSVRENCVFSQLSKIMEAVKAAELAQQGWEIARDHGNEAAQATQLERGRAALALAQGYRSDAAACVGREVGLVSARNGQSTVTVETTVRADDPQAGPVESWVIRPPRLDLAIGPAPFASPFQPIM